MKKVVIIALLSCFIFANDAADKAFQAKEYTKAFEILSKEAQQGNANSQYNLALMYYNGLGVEQNISKSLELLESAAQAGHKKAIANIGRIYMQVVDFDHAVKWLQLNAVKGDATAAYLLAEIYVEKGSFTEAKQWAKKAIDAGNNEALLLWQQYHLARY